MNRRDFVTKTATGLAAIPIASSVGEATPQNYSPITPTSTSPQLIGAPSKGQPIHVSGGIAVSDAFVTSLSFDRMAKRFSFVNFDRRSRSTTKAMLPAPYVYSSPVFTINGTLLTVVRRNANNFTLDEFTPDGAMISSRALTAPMRSFCALSEAAMGITPDGSLQIVKKTSDKALLLPSVRAISNAAVSLITPIATDACAQVDLEKGSIDVVDLDGQLRGSVDLSALPEIESARAFNAKQKKRDDSAPADRSGTRALLHYKVIHAAVGDQNGNLFVIFAPIDPTSGVRVTRINANGSVVGGFALTNPGRASGIAQIPLGLKRFGSELFAIYFDGQTASYLVNS